MPLRVDEQHAVTPFTIRVKCRGAKRIGRGGRNAVLIGIPLDQVPPCGTELGLSIAVRQYRNQLLQGCHPLPPDGLAAYSPRFGGLRMRSRETHGAWSAR